MLTVSIVWPFTTIARVPAGAVVYEPPDSGWVPLLTVTVRTQVVVSEHLFGVLMDTVGLASLQLCMLSVSLLLLLLPPATPTKMSAEKPLALVPPSVFLARSGVHEVAFLPETMSMVAEVLPLFGCTY